MATFLISDELNDARAFIIGLVTHVSDNPHHKAQQLFVFNCVGEQGLISQISPYGSLA